MLTVKNIATFSIAFILLTSLWFSCNFSQKETTKKNILQVDYYVRYLQSDQQVKARISFTEMDSTGKIIPKKMKEVLFANNALSGKRVGNQYRYQLEKKMPFAENYALSYRLSQMEIDSILIQQQSINDFSIKKGKVSKTAGTNLTFEGTLLSKKESLVILLSDINNKTVTIKIDDHPINSPISILPEQVNQLTTGKGMIYIVRKQTTEMQLVNAQLKGLTEYYSAIKEIEIIE